MGRTVLAFLVLALLAAQNARGADNQPSVYSWSGLPALQRFPPGARPGGLQSFAVTQTLDGEILVANADGVLRYYGGRWSLLDLPTLNTARSLGVGPKGQIYVGGYHHFGQLQRAANGRYDMVDLDDLFFPDNRGAPLAEIWEVIPVPEGVYFGTNSELFWVANDGQHQSWKIGGSGSATSYRVGAEIWVRRDDEVMLSLRDGELRPLLSEVPPMTWIGTRVSDGAVIALLRSGEFRQMHDGLLVPLAAASAAELSKSSPYCVLQLDDGSILVGALSGEVFWLNPDLSLRQLWPVSAFPVLAMGSDRENGLWLATDNEILRLDLSPRWSLLGPDRGYRGTLLDGGSYAGEVLLATSMGLYRDLGGGNLQLLGVEGRETHATQSVPGGALIATSDGVLLRKDDTLQTIAADANVLYVMASKQHPGVAYGIEDAGLLILSEDSGQWRESSRIIDPAYRFVSLSEDRQGHLWAGQVGDDPMQIQLSEDGKTVLDASRQSLGLNRSIGADSNTFAFQGDIYASINKGIYRWASDRFLADDLHGLTQLVGNQLTEIFVQDCGANRIFAGTSRQLLRWLDDRWQILPPMEGQAQGIIGFDCNSEGDSFITTWSGLARYRDGSVAPQPVPAIPVMEAVRVSQGESTSNLDLRPNSPPSIAAGSSVRFSFVLPSFDRGWRLQSRLSPLDSSWSDDPGLGLREFSAQSPGDFELQVRAIRGQSAEPQILSYPFSVIPHWYQTGWARLLAGFSLIIGILLLVRWRLAQITATNVALERVVGERTATLEARTEELVRANLQLQELADQDGLTGVANRRRLEHAVDHAFSAAISRSQNLALLMIDLDEFKQFNDRYGHLRGDDELRRAAQRMLSALDWSNSLLARYGGEEFVVMLPGASLNQALSLAAALRTAMHNDDPNQHQITISVGVAELRSHGATTANALLEQADQALYLAKGAGRDRVEIFRR